MWVLALVAFSVLLSLALTLISQPSSMSVAMGIIIVGLLLGIVIMMITRIVKQFKKRQARATAKRGGSSGKGARIVAVILVAALALSGNGCKRVGPGMAGIKVNMYGSNRGVADYPLVTGMVWYNPISTEIIEYPCFVQTAAWKDAEQLTFNTQDGMVITANISLSYQLSMDKAPAFYVKFRSDDIDSFTHGFMHNVARDAFNELGATYTVEDVYGPKKQDLLMRVQKQINDQMAPYGITIQQLGFLDALGIPPQVTAALNGKIQAQQDAMRVENEVQQAKAEAQKVVAKAEGDAQANNLLAKSITPELLEWQQLQLEQNAIAKWDGRRPMVESGGTGGNNLGMGMLMQLPAQLPAPAPAPATQ